MHEPYRRRNDAAAATAHPRQDGSESRFLSFFRYGFYVVSSLKQKLTKLPVATNKKLFENIKMQNCVSQITPWVDVLNGAWTTFWHSDVPQCHQRRQAHILTEHSLAQAVMQMQFTHAPSTGRLYMEVLVCR